MFLMGEGDVVLREGDLKGNYGRVLFAMLQVTDDPHDEELHSFEERIQGREVSLTITLGDHKLLVRAEEGAFELVALMMFLAEKHNTSSWNLSPEDATFIRSFYGGGGTVGQKERTAAGELLEALHLHERIDISISFH